MRESRTHQPFTYDVRLPDEAQADALRLLDASRAVVKTTLALLWPHLDEFGTERSGPPGNRLAPLRGPLIFMETANGGAKARSPVASCALRRSGTRPQTKRAEHIAWHCELP